MIRRVSVVVLTVVTVVGGSAWRVAKAPRLPNHHRLGREVGHSQSSFIIIVIGTALQQLSTLSKFGFQHQTSALAYLPLTTERHRKRVMLLDVFSLP